MRKRFIQINGELHEVKDGDQPFTPMIQPDIAPYKSMIDGSTIEGRAQHREHLKRHGYQEVGNDSSLYKQHNSIPDVSPQKRKELIRSQIASMTDRQFKEMHTKAINNWKWNSRER